MCEMFIKRWYTNIRRRNSIDAFLMRKTILSERCNLSLEQRLAHLKLSRDKRFEPQILEGAAVRCGKSPEESYMTEVGLCLTEIRHTMRHLRGLSAPADALPSSRNCPGAAGGLPRRAPWNYPSCSAVGPDHFSGTAASWPLKPSECSCHSSGPGRLSLPVLISVSPHRFRWCGGRCCRNRAAYHLNFFTGGAAVGRKVMAAAAET